jgi:uncharacterized lipoprotein YddW (UPF0748 family)
MKKNILTVIILLSLYINVSSQPINELRAVWLTNVDSDVLLTDAKISEAMDYLASINVNVVFPVVWNKGYPLFPSEVMDDYFGITIWPTVQGRDPLERVIIEAHRNGIEVIPWFEFGFATSFSQNGGHILAAYPDWALKNSQGNLVVKNGFDWMSGINPEVQEFMTKLMLEIIDKYDVDGVQGDDRLPAMPVEGGYEDYTVNLYKSEHNDASPPTNFNDASWKRWRADKLIDFFQNLRDSVKSRSDHLELSVSPSPYPWGYDNYLQDSKSWVQQGIPDNVIPQLYRQNLSSYITELNIAISHVPNDKDKLFAGVLAKAGSYVVSPSLLLGSIQANRDKGVMGESLFFYEALRRDNNLLGDTLKAIHYNLPAINPFRNEIVWRPKATILNEDDPGVDLIGNWEQFPINGYEPNIYISNDPNYTAIEYNFDVPYEAWFDLFIYNVPNTVNTDSARFTVYSGLDSTIVYVDQRDLDNKGWQKLSTSFLNAGNQKVIKLDNVGVESGKYISADAAMIMINRKLSPDVVITSIKDEKNSVSRSPEYFNLYQNYPNPFNPNTTIEFAINSPQFVTLKIYDVLGKELATLVNDYKLAGLHRIDFDASEFSSGVYFYKLNLNNTAVSKKMILLK